MVVKATRLVKSSRPTGACHLLPVVLNASEISAYIHYLAFDSELTGYQL